MFSESDLKQIAEKNITVEQVKQQIEVFKKGIPAVKLVQSATVGNGIKQLSEQEKAHYITNFNTKKDKLKLLKFVPASGAATRMFKELFLFLNNFNPESETFNAYVNKTKALSLSLFFTALDKLPFYNIIINNLKHKNIAFDTLDDNQQKVVFVKEMLLSEGANFGSFPKGLLPFHNYKTHYATALEEHLFEAALYSEANNKANLHFTISEEHKDAFLAKLKEILPKVKEITGVDFNVSFSFQKQATDTIAVNLDNTPFRNPDNTLLFRPSGHGALIENLNDQDADIVFIKNIDNVVVKKQHNAIADAKKMLAGLLLAIQEKVFAYAKLLDAQSITNEQVQEIKLFLENDLNVKFSEDFNAKTFNEQINIIKAKLNRPIRVCGMVKNEGEPGGGPFWIKDKKGNISLQIVESAQIDKSNQQQKEILSTATHFNPVDIVCGVKNYKGEKYNLLDFVDASQAFITQKTKEGKPLKALELPGLWNGAMANWNTIFVEVPLHTFNPVKTVTDLLKPAHQVK